MDKVLRTAVCGQTFVDKVLWTEVCDKVLWTTVCGQAFVDKDLWTAVCLRLQFAVWMQKPDASKLSPCIHLVFAAFVITLSASRPRFFPNLSALLSALFPQRVRAFFRNLSALSPQRVRAFSATCPRIFPHRARKHTATASGPHHVREILTPCPQVIHMASARPAQHVREFLHPVRRFSARCAQYPKLSTPCSRAGFGALLEVAGLEGSALRLRF